MSENEPAGLYFDRDSIVEDDLSEIQYSEEVWSIEIDEENRDILKRVLSPGLKSKEFEKELEEIESSFVGFWFPDTRYIIEQSNLVPTFTRSLNIVKDEQDLDAILSKAVEFLLESLGDSDEFLHENPHQLSEQQVNQMDTELLISVNSVMIPNYARGETWDRILSLREHSANLSRELAQKKKSLMAGDQQDGGIDWSVEPEVTASLIGTEIEKMAAETIENKKTQEFYREEIGGDHSLAPEPEMVLLVLQSGYLLLESGKILNEHRPDEYVKKRGAEVIEKLREKVPSENLRELESDEEVADTMQATLEEWDSD
ncbi:hypothetical protein ACOZ4F_13585 [Haloarcula marismortui]|uniref:hypothetical protein n=1 Tax=Haloarcula marismortui TaxID=2238 RepID=UPI003C7956AA